MILVGWGGSAKILGKGPTRTCERCGNTNPWFVAETSKKVRLYFVPVAKWATEYWFACPVCKAGVALESRDQALAIARGAALEA